MRRVAIAAMVSVLFGGAARAQAADADIFQKEKIQAMMKNVADYQVKLDESEGKKDPNWVRAVFYTGVMATYRITGDEKYIEQAKKYCADEANWMVTGGPARRPKTGRRHADRQCIGQTYCELYAIKPDEQMIADLKKVYAEMQAAPSTGRVEWNWCDSLFMAPPTLARLAKITGDTQYLKFMDTMYWDTTDFLKDKEEHLFYRDASYFFNMNTPKGHSKNGKKVFWARGNGWVVAGLTRILDYLPADWPTRDKYLALYKEMCAKLVTLQGEDGMWRASLLDPEDVPNPEESGSGFFVEAFAWGVNNGVLDKATYEPAVRKGWTALVKCVNAEGRVGWVQRGGAAPAPTTEHETYEFGTGAWLLAAEQIARMKQ
jgi:unsaturated rhamnogalacturonyl hydrolase